MSEDNKIVVTATEDDMTIDGTSLGHELQVRELSVTQQLLLLFFLRGERDKEWCVELLNWGKENLDKIMNENKEVDLEIGEDIVD